MTHEKAFKTEFFFFSAHPPPPPFTPLAILPRRFNSSLRNVLVDGLDNFRINYVKFSWRNKSMNFSLTFNDLRLNGSYAGAGNFINYVPIRGRGKYNFDVYSEGFLPIRKFVSQSQMTFIFHPDLTTNVAAIVTIKRFRMQITNFTTISRMDRVKVGEHIN